MSAGRSSHAERRGGSVAPAARTSLRSKIRHSGLGAPLALDRIQDLTLDELREQWRSVLDESAPDLHSRDLMVRLLAWKIQAQQYGGLPPRIERRLKDLKAAFAKDPHYTPAPLISLLPGTVLVREWKGVTHRVLDEQNGFVYEGQRYASLTDLARTITGTAWSGPRFFGLERKAKELRGRP